MRLLAFANRNAKEILRDLLNLAFGLGFPLVLILLMSAIQANVPVPLFEIRQLAPGISVFGLSFLSLFAATLLARDRESALLQRLYTTPLTAEDFIFGYLLPLLPIAAAQSAVCYLFALLFGLRLSPALLLAVLCNLPTALFFIAFGLLCGSIMSVKQVGGICGALLTNLTAWLSGAWFDLNLVGGVFRRIAQLLPFYHATELERAIVHGSLSGTLPHLVWILAYAATATAAAIALFLWQMRRQ